MSNYYKVGCGIIVVISALVLDYVLDACYWGPWPLTGEAMECLERGDFENALTLANRAVATGRKMELTYWTRGMVREARHEYREAIQDYTEALSLSHDLFSLCNRGRAYEKAGQFRMAVADYCEALHRPGAVRDVAGAVRDVAWARLKEPGRRSNDHNVDEVSLLLGFISEAARQEPDNLELQKCKEMIVEQIRRLGKD